MVWFQQMQMWFTKPWIQHTTMDPGLCGFCLAPKSSGVPQNVTNICLIQKVAIHPQLAWSESQNHSRLAMFHSMIAGTVGIAPTFVAEIARWRQVLIPLLLSILQLEQKDWQPSFVFCQAQLDDFCGNERSSWHGSLCLSAACVWKKEVFEASQQPPSGRTCLELELLQIQPSLQLATFFIWQKKSVWLLSDIKLWASDIHRPQFRWKHGLRAARAFTMGWESLVETQRLGVSSSSWGYSKLAGWFISGKIPI